MATKVLDSWALMALFEDAAAAGEVEKLLFKAADGKVRLLLCAVNWGEIYYAIARAYGQAAADQKAAEIASLPIEIVAVGEDLALARQAALFKATHKMSCAHCFAAALAKLKNAELVTGDPEFEEVEKEIRIQWL